MYIKALHLISFPIIFVIFQFNILAESSRKGKFPAEGQNCLSCHGGIEPIRDHNSEMMKQIYALGSNVGDPNGCVVCHGGNPNELNNKSLAHKGAPKGNTIDFFTPVPGAMSVNDKTCGNCHKDHSYNVHRSMMNTDAGKIKAILWSWGIGTENYDHLYGDHAVDDPDGPVPRFGTKTYKDYMLDLAKRNPSQFPSELKKIPQTDVKNLKDNPEHAAFAYLRNCNSCHLSQKGLEDRGHFRGMGCSSCHMLYGTEGYYEGNDKSINKKEQGHVLVHTMQSSRKTKLEVNGKTISGIQVSTCATCHAGGRRIGHSYQGLMPLGSSLNRGTFDKYGRAQEKNAGYVFKKAQNDAHHQFDTKGNTKGGLLCQDCHTSNSMHGNGNIGVTTLATIEIECADCHGTPKKYPWELPIGYGEEFGKDIDMNTERGLSKKPMKVTQDFGTVYPSRDGFLLSARGNPLGNVVKDGKKVIVHSANGLDFEVPVLKQLEIDNAWKNPVKARTAMVTVSKHMDSLECYACHSTWAAQYYGYKYVIDFTKQSIDWIDSSESLNKDGTTAEYDKKYIMQQGAPGLGDYSHVRWENPPLGINGEGRVSPLVGVIQTVATVIGQDGEPIISNYVADTKDGKKAITLAPLNPHTTSRQSRECQDCHGNQLVSGYGLDGGVYDANPQASTIASAVTNDGQLVSKYAKEQIPAIKNLHGDFMQILSRDGIQQITVDSHWERSGPLTKEQREKLDRSLTCTACHQDITNKNIPANILHKVAIAANLSFSDGDIHANLIRQNNILAAWVKAILIILGLLIAPLLLTLIFKRKQAKAFFKRFLTKMASKL